MDLFFKLQMATFNRGWSGTRNLGKNQLGGVIFGAKNTTFNECLSKQLFGLPNPHFVYVEKIEPGLPLFLFNYSDRTLHGIFEAASHGQKNIDPCCWTSDGLQKTPYPAQVQVRIRSPCQPLTENQFKPIIVDNYYTQNHFWFELDHSQTNKLLSLFSSRSPSAPQSTLTPHYATKWSIRLPSVSKSDEKVEKEDNNALKNVITNDSSKENVLAKSSEGPPTIAQLIEKVEDLMAFKTAQNYKNGYMEKKIVSLRQNLAEAEKEIRNLKCRCNTLESMVGAPEEFYTINERKLRELQLDDPPETREFHLDSSLERSDIHLDSDDLILLVGGYDGTSWSSSLDSFSPSQCQTKSLKPMDTTRCYAPVSKLDGEFYVFGGGTSGVCYDTVESYDPILNEWTARPPLNARKGSLAGATVNDKIYAVGGESGNECYSAVEMLDLNVGAWIASRPMLEKRFSLAAAELNGALYAVGGYDGENYLKTAERYDPREHSWTRIKSMNTLRGSPCLVALNEKLYVLGGFDANSMVPTVEIYDPRRGSWVIGESMKYPRGFFAAAVVKESIYVFGGLKTGDEINDTVECYKEGRGWEITDTKAVGKRCFFSAVAL
ncbi:hypothetical protein OSB04_023225 [Centaurea solstitialis]|uniref:DCD domain-containing protein n=1 Tax=Centaurea solstitialis TaxID=347529 RepID=A0AA38T3F7_9ASTR|nr:hypothetical protein OSB04_023225 [Centaurea solstitialis]